jgi:hypothetical protein
LLSPGTCRKLSANPSPPSCRAMALPMSSRRRLEVGSASRCTMPSKASPREFLADFAPTLAMMGKDLARSTPGRETASTGAPVFRHGSAASDDVHAILRNVRGITRVVGHSKGALAVENALRSFVRSDARDFGSHIRLRNFRSCSLQTVLSISRLDRRTWILEFPQQFSRTQAACGPQYQFSLSVESAGHQFTRKCERLATDP